MEKETKQIIIYLAIIAIFLSMLSLFAPKKTGEAEENVSQRSFYSVSLPNVFFKSENSTIVSLKVPAVDSEGKGAAVLLVVDSVKGSGRTLVDIDGLLFWADTQHSIRMARMMAGNVSGKNLSEFDLIYSVRADASIIGGPSAGAALAVATIFALKGEKPRENVMITGTINHDGTIGPVESVLEKAISAKKVNASLVLVPLLQGKDVIYEERKYCHKFGTSEVCTMESVPKEVDISKEANITVREVKNLEEALEYFRA